MADFLAELEGMAANAAQVTEQVQEQQICAEDVQRWQKLFDFSYADALEHITLHREDIWRSKVSDELWTIVKKDQEDAGFDRESYEYALKSGYLGKATKKAMSDSAHDSPNKVYILKLEGPLPSAEKVKEIANLNSIPEVAKGTGETGDAMFCKINGVTRQKIIDWLSIAHPFFRTTIIRLSKSPKDLSTSTMSPMLGLDMTLPHHRPNDSDFVPLPAPDQYPVWYFFYGNLAKSEELQRRLNLTAPPNYVPARVQGGKIRSWRDQYRAMVDTGADCYEEGSAYLVQSKEHEEVLQFYETEKYEVVRCVIDMEGGSVNGLVFRFAGRDEDLQ